jgi:hypothetical protein
MKYALGLSFEFKYYKHPANIKIFSNNQLIDDIDLTEDINSTNMTPVTLCKNIPVYNDWYYPWWNTYTQPSGYEIWYKKIPEKMFVYTLDETNVQDSIRVEVTNDNTNNSNGFMTKWSSFTFRHIFLIPTYYLDLKNYASFLNNAKCKDWVINEAKGNEEKFRKANKINDKYALSNFLLWPDEYRSVKNGKISNCFYNKDNDDWNKDGLFWKDQEKGGSFSIELPIIEYSQQRELKMLGPINYEQLLEKEKRYLYQSDVCPLYFNHLNLINIQNETA